MVYPLGVCLPIMFLFVLEKGDNAGTMEAQGISLGRNWDAHTECQFAFATEVVYSLSRPCLEHKILQKEN